jgi:glycosyltransferase involved in cell wall biosynthesis
MSSALRQADLLIFPSTYEGFGLPVLEAMDAGVPVVASRVAFAARSRGRCGMLF